MFIFEAQASSCPLIQVSPAFFPFNPLENPRNYSSFTFNHHAGAYQNLISFSISFPLSKQGTSSFLFTSPLECTLASDSKYHVLLPCPSFPNLPKYFSVLSFLKTKFLPLSRCGFKIRIPIICQLKPFMSVWLQSTSKSIVPFFVQASLFI